MQCIIDFLNDFYLELPRTRISIAGAISPAIR